MTLTHEQCFRASRSGDARFDGRFFTGVTSTGVYCRPICRVRPPKRENMRFYPIAAAAEAAGGGAGDAGLERRIRDRVASAAADRGGRAGGARRRGTRGRAGDRGAPAATAVRRAGGGVTGGRGFNHAIRASFGRPPRELRRARPNAPAEPAGLSFRLPDDEPFEWTAILRYLAHGVEAIDGGVYRRLIGSVDAPTLVELRNEPGRAAMQLRVTPADGRELLEVVGAARRFLDLDADPQAIQEHLAADPRLAAGVKAHPGLRVPGAWDPFEVAVRAILGQAVSVAAASNLIARFVAQLGVPVGGFADLGLTHLFPTPEAVARADLSAVGLPRSRQAALQALARAMVTERVSLDAVRGLDDLVESLCAIDGIGPWTAQYIAMRGCGEPDAFPSGDLVLRSALSTNGAYLSRRAAEAAAEGWRPWRAYAAMQLWVGEQRAGEGTR